MAGQKRVEDGCTRIYFCGDRRCMKMEGRDCKAFTKPEEVGATDSNHFGFLTEKFLETTEG